MAELSESLEVREPDLLGELRQSADYLKSLSSEEIRNEIDTTVNETVVSWNDSRKSVHGLCERYQNAVRIWSTYRKNSDIVNEWVDNQLNSLSNLPAEEALHQLQIYEDAVNEQSEKLFELRGMVMEIATEVGVNEDNLLADEIVLLSRKLEDVKSAITTLNNVTANKKRKVFIDELEETEKCLSSMKKDLLANGELKNEESIEQIYKLKDKLHSLTQTDTILSHMRTEQVEILTDPQASIHNAKISVVELLESWQQVFRETFQQYHKLFSTIAREQDCTEALKLWTDYLQSIQQFLSLPVPDNYYNLSGDEQMCQMYENLLLSQESILAEEKSKRKDETSTESYNELTHLHNETLASICSRHNEVKRRLNCWQRYQKDQKELLSWLRMIETEQSRLNLKYIYIRTIDTNLRRIEDLLTKIPEGITLADHLREQHAELLSGCGPVVSNSVQMELDWHYKRIHNLEAALKTWREYLEKIKSVSVLYEEVVANIDKIFISVHESIDREICQSSQSTYYVRDLEEKIKRLKDYQDQIVCLDLEFSELSELEEKLKQSVNPKDMKMIRQRIWLLKQQQNDLKCELSTFIFQFEEKLALWEQFEKRSADFLTWAIELNNRLEKFSLTANHPEIVLRRLEVEFCAEVDAKHEEYSWLSKTGDLLVPFESSEVKIQDKINNIHEVWKQINDNTKGEVEKVKHIVKQMELLRESVKQLNIWLHRTTNNLNRTIFFDKFDDSALVEKLEEHKVIENEIEAKTSEISGALEESEIFLLDCENCNVSLDVKSFIVNYDSLEKGWSRLQLNCAEAKDRILVIWKLIQEILSLCRTEDPWLTEQHNQLVTLQEKCKTVSFSSINSVITKVDAILTGINNHATQFKLLEELYSDLLSKNHVRGMDIAQDTLDRYEALRKFAITILESVNSDLHQWKEFSSSHAKLFMQLTQLDGKLTQLQHLDNSEDSEQTEVNKRKLEKLQVLDTELESLNEIIKRTNVLGSNLLKNDKKLDVSSVTEMMDEYTTLYKDIKKRIKTLNKFYRKELSNRSSMHEEVQVETLKFEKDFAAQVDTLPSSFQRKDAFSYELQNVMKETRDNVEQLVQLSDGDGIEEITKAIGNCQASVDLMKHLSAVLVGQCGMPSDEPVLAQVEELDINFQQVLAEVRYKQQNREQQQFGSNSEIGRLRCPLCSERNWSQLDNDMWRLEKWLEQAQGTLQTNPLTPPENIEQLEDVIQEHKEFMVYLDSHRDVIVSLNIVGKHLMDHSENKMQSLVLQERLNRVNETWEKVCAQSIVWRNKLQNALMENDQFHNIIEELLTWTEDTENSIRSSEPVDLTEDRVVIKAKYNRFKKLHKELKRCEPRVASLQAANQVCATSQINVLEASQNKLDHLRLRLQSLIRLTWIYMLKLGSVLGHNVNDICSTVDLSTASPMTLSQEFLDENLTVAMDRADTPESTTSNDDENRSVLVRGHRFFGRVIRASLPIQAFIFVMLGVVSLFPRIEEEFSCATANNMAWSLEPILRYPDGPPPT